jgi:type IV fimbrial biogenesis protein FimT
MKTLFKNSAINRGFTLVEMMVTVAVLAVVITVAVPSFASLIASNRLSAEANDSLSAFYLARAEAIKLNQTVRLCHSADGVQCSAAPNTGWRGWIVVPEVANPTVVASAILSSDQIIIQSSAALANQGDIVRLTPQGLVRGVNNAPLNATLRVCVTNSKVSDNIRDIEMRSGGRARVLTRNMAGSCPLPQN